MEETIDYLKLRQAVLEQYALEPHSIHGVAHWEQVEYNGLLMARANGADETVVRLFALFHDARRANEGTDPAHGPNGAALARAWRGVRYELDDARFAQLCRACEIHTAARQPTGDVTVDTCIDADRLDLGRVDYMPDPARLLTAAGQAIATEALQQGVTTWDYRAWIRRGTFLTRVGLFDITNKN